MVGWRLWFAVLEESIALQKSSCVRSLQLEVQVPISNGQWLSLQQKNTVLESPDDLLHHVHRIESIDEGLSDGSCVSWDNIRSVTERIDM